MNIWLKRAILTAVGATGGFAYYHFVGCVTGSCPITSNPVASTAYGALIGIVLGWGNKKR